MNWQHIFFTKTCIVRGKFLRKWKNIYLSFHRTTLFWHQDYADTGYMWYQCKWPDDYSRHCQDITLLVGLRSKRIKIMFSPCPEMETGVAHSAPAEASNDRRRSTDVQTVHWGGWGHCLSSHPSLRPIVFFIKFILQPQSYTVDTVRSVLNNR